MVGASKILTVSYGTFSCTLEGFDDPFSTMKAIAEYFRELAAEDRYFGAEPPTPDAEMLHRIAEREIQRRVEAKIQANGVVLRQEESSGSEPVPRVTMGQPAAAAAAVAVPHPAPETPQAVQPQVAEVPAPETRTLHVEAQIPAAGTLADDSEEDDAGLPAAEAAAPATEAESVAAKLMRIRAAVAESRATAPAAASAAAGAAVAAGPAVAMPAAVEEVPAEASVEEIAAAEPVEAPAAEVEPALAAAEPTADAAPVAEAEPFADTAAADPVGHAEDAAVAGPEDWSPAAPEPEAVAEVAALTEAEFADDAAMLDSLAASLAADEPALEPALEDAGAAPVEAGEATSALAAEDGASAEPMAEAEAEEPVAENLSAEEPIADDWDLEGSIADELAADEPIADAAEMLAPEAAGELSELTALADLSLEFEAGQAEAEPVLAKSAESTELGFGGEGVWLLDDQDQDSEGEKDDSREGEAALSEPDTDEEELTDTLPEALAAIFAADSSAEAADGQGAADAVAVDKAGEIESLESQDAESAGFETGAFETETFALETFELETYEVESFEASPATEVEAAEADDLPETLAAIFAAETELAAPLADEDETDVLGARPEAEDSALAEDAAEIVATEAEVETQPEPEPRAENALQRARARVIKVRRIEVAADPRPAAQPEPQAESRPEPQADPVLSGIGAALGDTGLSAEDEADLMAELAAVEREVTGPRAARAPQASETEARALPAPKQPEIEDAEIVGSDSDRPALGRGPADEAAVSRLIETANSRLEGSETRRRFSAIAHLKAAVAATVADRAMQTEAAGTALAQDSEEAIDRYRDDLTKAVRPRRPGAEGETANTPRPDAARPQAPLVLVSEQRVDRPAAVPAQEAGVIRPRRVTTSTLRLTEMLSSGEDETEEDVPAPTPEEARSFAEFASRLGASGLADLLEAAAAYTAAVEGRPHFSRPQIIKKIAHLAEETDREASLRSFGMLLRQGKIQKVKRGQFAISDSSRFMSEARRASR